MRVIAGSHRGRRLVGPDTPETRPVTDRAKESIFSSLGPLVFDARVVDLYAGAGSFGIEALSRGAASVVFVERGRRALDALHANLETLGLDSTTVVRGAVEAFVDGPGDRFDLAFCDPPWSLDSESLSSVLERLRRRLGPGALVIVTRRAGDSLPTPEGYRIDDDRRIGDTRILRYANMEVE